MLLLYGVFYLFPIGWGLVGSFADWNPIKGEFNFIGLANYIELMGDPLFLQSVGTTMVFTVVCTLCTSGLGLLLAVLVCGTRRMQNFFKTCIYLPYITAIMSVAVVWRWIFLAQGGLLNNILSSLGMQSVDWLGTSSTVMPSLMLMTIWHDVGFSLILFIAGISDISPVLYEAAKVDGANAFHLFRYITVPMLSRTTALVVVSNIITYVQVYDQVMALTKGGPGDASYTATYYLFDKALGYYRFGYASATAVVLLVIIMLLSLLQFKLSGDD
ncbi:MAG TPA: sugar ABC transporter permease [Candidatus Fournierella pullicola]|uniref:Sugar ABC transporter permease n=1 Tax=Candidatus Allofournierella pullicola TaxID=2838596 RepID=A0A9D1V4K4_9FIRM|nr:sugar ABC transporter permease [Candidatus Fournierella pullicola]